MNHKHLDLDWFETRQVDDYTVRCYLGMNNDGIITFDVPTEIMERVNATMELHRQNELMDEDYVDDRISHLVSRYMKPTSEVH